MYDTPKTVIGHIVDVQGNLLIATLVEDEQGHVPTLQSAMRMCWSGS